MIETHITTIIECDKCESQYEIDADLMVEMRLIDLDEIEERAEKECLRKGWIRRLIKGSPYVHLCPHCSGVAS